MAGIDVPSALSTRPMQTFTPIVLTAPSAIPAVALDLLRVVSDRLFVCSNSGGGKSHAARLMIEQAGQQMPVYVVDSEGEWASVRAAISGMVLIGSIARGADALADPRLAGALAMRLLELNCSAVLDLSDLSRDDQAVFVRDFLNGLFNAPPELCNQGRPRLVVIDEAHRFAPEDKGEAASRAAVIQLMDSGRKRGLGAVLVTQRFAKVAKSAIGEANNLLIGRFASDVDQRRAADIAGIPARRRGEFGDFEEGEFMAAGVAFGNKGKAIRFRTNPTTVTQHPKPGMQAFAPPVRSTKLASQFKDLRIVESEAEPEQGAATGHARTREISEYAKLEDEVAELRSKLAQSQADLAETEARYKAIIARLRKASAELAVALSYVVEIEAIASVAAEPVDIDDAEPETTEREQIDEQPTSAPRRKTDTSTGIGNGAARRLLVALVQSGKPLTRTRAAFLAKISPKSSTFGIAIAALRGAGFMTSMSGGKVLEATPDGVHEAGKVPPMPTGVQLIDYWGSRLGTGANQRVFMALSRARGPMSRQAVADAANVSLTASTFGIAIAKLRGLGLIVNAPGKQLALSQELR
jgi:hypothetical protein